MRRSAPVEGETDSERWQRFAPRMARGIPGEGPVREQFEAESRQSTQARARLGNRVTRRLRPPVSRSASWRAEAVCSTRRSPTRRMCCARWQFVLLIHGYNNDLAAGSKANKGFWSVQEEIGYIAKPLVNIYWPGDADWGIVSALYYPLSVGRAQQSTPVLSRALREAVALSGFEQIDIVSHSTGGRVVVELIKELQAMPGILVRHVAFMAAALPTFKLTPGDRSKLSEAYDSVVTGGAVSLFSPDDMVLALAFPAGQTLAGSGEGWFPTALDHEQWQSPLEPATLGQKQIYGAGHSDYWGWNEKTRHQARQAGRIMREFLELGPIPERVPDERVGAEARETPTRGIESP